MCAAKVQGLAALLQLRNRVMHNAQTCGDRFGYVSCMWLGKVQCTVSRLAARHQAGWPCTAQCDAC